MLAALYIRAGGPISMNMKPEQLLNSTPKGLYCPAGDFYIDPVRPVARALITHGHSDHARAGHGAVLATRQTLDCPRHPEGVMALEDFDGDGILDFAFTMPGGGLVMTARGQP